MRRLHFALLSLVLAVAAQPLVATTYYVGTCKTGAFGSISAAVATVPAGSIIDVCPGSYPEQVVISKALTLQGLSSNNSSQAVIAVPSGGLTTTSSIQFGTVAAQVQIAAGPVNITNITIDGTVGNGNCPSVFLIGLFYSSGSSGTVNQVEARNQNCRSYGGNGILAENGAGAVQSITIQNSNLHDDSYAGIVTNCNQTPSTLNVSIKGNSIVGTNGIFASGTVAGTVSGNVVNANQNGIYVAGSPVSVTGNTIMGAVVGIEVGPGVVSGNIISNALAGIQVHVPGIVMSNQITNSNYGFYIYTDNASIKSNTITKSNIGIEFGCHTNTITGNTINGATTGIDQVPAAFTGVNKFYNVPTVRTNGPC